MDGDGTKLNPFIVFGGAKRESKALNDEFKARCCVASSANAWMNEELTKVCISSSLACMGLIRMPYNK